MTRVFPLWFLFAWLGMIPIGNASFSDWKIGPGVLLGIPHPVTVSADARLKTDDLSLGAGAGYLPFSSRFETTPVDLVVSNFDLRARWHPFHGSFFIGAILGRQWLSGSGTDLIPLTVGPSTIDVPVRVSSRVSNSYLTPHLGWLWIFDSGFTLGIDAGVQAGFKSSTTLDVTIEDATLDSYFDLIKQTRRYQDLESRTATGLNRIGTLRIPYVTALRVGWMF